MAPSITIELCEDGSIDVFGLEEPEVREWCERHARTLTITLNDESDAEEADSPQIIEASV